MLQSGMLIPSFGVQDPLEAFVWLEQVCANHVYARQDDAGLQNRQKTMIEETIISANSNLKILGYFCSCYSC